LDTTGILEAAADGRVDVLVLLGADPLTDFPDRDLARRAMAGARTVISVDPFLNGTAAHVDVVLAAATFGEVEGTTTSCEGRVTVLGQRVTPPGTARADWIIAGDLAARLGADLGVVDGPGDLWDELCGLSPAHAGLAGDALRAPDAADGLLLAPSGRSVPDMGGEPAPPANAYSLRLVVDRLLYDRGTLLSESPSSSGLARAATLRVAPGDAAPLGITGGTRVKVTSPHGSIEVDAAADPAVARGVAVLAHNLEGADPGELLSVGDVVCDVRVEVA
jgi:NADH-quinone oxidoreductase subunit G